MSHVICEDHLEQWSSLLPLSEISMFHCLTCLATHDDAEMLKHLSSTRHKLVRYVLLDEVIACEECHDTNVHQLVLCRIGLADMALLCQLCLAKDEKPATQYTLSNGSLLRKLPDYFKFRDISCQYCGAERHLSVANAPKGQVVVCRKCVDKCDPKLKLVSEDSDGFLYALLGIKEFVPRPQKNGKGRARKVGRKGGARLKPNASTKDSPFHAARAEAMAKKTGKTVAAVGADPSQLKAKPGKTSGKQTGRQPGNLKKELAKPGKFGSNKPPKLSDRATTSAQGGSFSQPPKAKGDQSKGSSHTLAPPRSSDALVLPKHLSRYEPSPEPLLLYPSMEKYYQEMSHNLFLEEKLSMHSSNNVMLDAGDMLIEWYADQNKKHRQFKVSMLLSDDLVNRLMSKKLQQIRKNPLAANQTVFLVLGNDIAWYGNILTTDTYSAQKGRKGGPKVFEMVVELYKWNYQPLPTTIDIRWLRVLPALVPVSRCFTAMSRLLNPKFKSMLLGHEPIKQIVFRNYLKYSRDTLNTSQKVAIQSVLNNSITVLQGPPGTGKTSTIFEIILQLLDNLSTYPILVVAASNIAIDNIAEKLLATHKHSILRIVSNEKEREYSREHPLGPICLHHKVHDALPNALKEIINDLRNPRALVSPNQFKKLLTQQIDVSDRFIAQARVIFTTTVVAGGNQLKLVKKFPVVIMDEATQSSEATTLIPLLMPDVEKFVFVGDQKQLSSFSQVPNLLLSLFERVLLNGTYKTAHMLDTQYRMHPLISDFPRRRFYNSLLQDGITAEQRQWASPIANPVYFWDTQRQHNEGRVLTGFREDRGFTYSNNGEVSLVVEVLTKLIFEKGVPKSDIGIITPYRGQRDLISSTLVKNELINPEHNDILVEVDRDDIYNDSKPVTIHTVSDIMIASIDAFQGREKNFLVMSCVRSNPENKIGFLKDERRLNVALTRAKYSLVLIGDVECLRKGDSLWKEYLDDLEQKGCIFKIKEFAY